MSTEVKIKVSNLYKSFGRKRVLKNLSLEVCKSKSLVILGMSGTGKSVLIKNIATFMKPDSGSIQIDGKEVTNLSQKDKYRLMNKLSFLFQGGALFDSLTVWENVAFKLLKNKILKKEAKEIAIEKLTEVDLGSKTADLYPSELSGGMQKRVALARAVATTPEIIFFDEPTTGLDPITANVINRLIKNLSEKIKATTITITHDINSAAQIADQVALLHRGQIIWHGDSESMQSDTNEYIDQFVKGSIEGPIHSE